MQSESRDDSAESIGFTLCLKRPGSCSVNIIGGRIWVDGCRAKSQSKTVGGDGFRAGEESDLRKVESRDEHVSFNSQTECSGEFRRIGSDRGQRCIVSVYGGHAACPKWQTY